MMNSLFLAALLALAPGAASAQSTSTGGAQQVMTETAGSCLCPGGKEMKPECCPPPDKKEEGGKKPAEEKK